MELKEDWLSLRSWMENHHPNLYLYTSKSVIDSVFDAVEGSLTQPMTVIQFYNRISTIQPYVKDGHNILLPSEKYQAYCNDHALYFPLTVAWLEGNMVVTQNQSDEPILIPGTIIQRLNGRPTDSLFDDMVDRLMRDGNNLNYPEYMVPNYFRTFYGFFFGFPEMHELTVKLPDGTVRNMRLKALPLDTIKHRRKTIIPKRYDRLDYDKAIFWSTEPNSELAVLNIRTWHPDQLKKQYKQSFKKEIDDCIETLNAQKTAALVIDLRGNQGGEADYGIYLAKRLLNEPFTYFDDVKKLNKRQELVETSRGLTRTYKPIKNRYRGKVVLLVDGGSYSNTAIFAALLKKHKRATIAGTETGGSRVILAGGGAYFKSPNTQVQVLKATHRMIINKQQAITGSGVQPDLVFKPTPEQVINNKDVLWEDVLLMLIEK
ncbi:MAG: S41 family peptidase [Saprospiraceae bacterium]|nr:S41 family peptidase [Saprospiraceae bacterium]